MQTCNPQQTIGEILTQVPGASHVFVTLGINHDCEGMHTLAEFCHEKGLDLTAVLNRLKEEDYTAGANVLPVDVTAMSLTELADHIETTHHAYLHVELPHLALTVREVGSLHRGTDPRLRQVQETYKTIALELWCHIFKEEKCLFPKIRQLEAGDEAPAHCGTIAGPIRQMESEHDRATAGLEQLRQLTDGFVPPAWATEPHRDLLAAFARLERDMHVHIHKENQFLFPRALELEARKCRYSPA
jgi:regulator of cell morphogenesis and NO signaling